MQDVWGRLHATVYGPISQTLPAIGRRGPNTDLFGIPEMKLVQRAKPTCFQKRNNANNGEAEEQRLRPCARKYFSRTSLRNLTLMSRSMNSNRSQSIIDGTTPRFTSRSANLRQMQLSFSFAGSNQSLLVSCQDSNGCGVMPDRLKLLIRRP